MSVGPTRPRATDRLTRSGPRARIFLLPDEVLRDARTAAAEGARPVKSGPATIEERALPALGELHLFRRRLRLSEGGCAPARGQMRCQPAAELLAEGGLRFAVAQVHEERVLPGL